MIDSKDYAVVTQFDLGNSIIESGSEDTVYADMHKARKTLEETVSMLYQCSYVHADSFVAECKNVSTAAEIYTDSIDQLNEYVASVKNAVRGCSVEAEPSEFADTLVKELKLKKTEYRPKLKDISS